jgi:hypothetical protein
MVHDESYGSGDDAEDDQPVYEGHVVGDENRRPQLRYIFPAFYLETVEHPGQYPADKSYDDHPVNVSLPGLRRPGMKKRLKILVCTEIQIHAFAPSFQKFSIQV